MLDQGGDATGTMGAYIDQHVGSPTLDKLSPHVLGRKTRARKKKKKQKEKKRKSTKLTSQECREQMIVISLRDDIRKKELETQELIQQLEHAKSEAMKKKEKQNQTKEKTRRSIELSDDDLAERLKTMEAEYKALRVTVDQRQANVDAIKAEIEHRKSSNQVKEREWKGEYDATLPLLLKQQNLRAEIREAVAELHGLEIKVTRCKNKRSIEKDLKVIYEKAYKEILELQQQHEHEQQQWMGFVATPG